MLGVNLAYVTAIGRLIGVVGLRELRQAIENANSNKKCDEEGGSGGGGGGGDGSKMTVLSEAKRNGEGEKGEAGGSLEDPQSDDTESEVTFGL